MIGIEKLIAVASPPKCGVVTAAPDKWDKLEAKFHLKFPDDYKLLIKTYGAGKFADFFGVVNPFCKSSSSVEFEEFVRLRTRDMTEAKVSYPKTAVSLPIYPQSGGLFPWGYTDNGETMCWLTDGKNSDWPIICLEVGYLNNYDRYNLPITEFIEKWLTNQISVPSLTPPDFYPLKLPIFSPYL